MSLFCEITKKNIQATNEGWGLALTLPIPGSVVLLAGVRAYSKNNLHKIFKNKKLVTYVEKECKAKMLELKKNDKSITNILPTGFLNDIAKWWHNTDEADLNTYAGLSHFKETGSKYLTLKIPNYYISVFFDTDHIEAIVCVYYSKNKQKFVGKRLTPPTKKDLKYYEEFK